MEKLFDNLDKIIKKEEPLRQPPIMIVHIPANSIKELYTSFRSKLKDFKMRHSEWNYYLMNVEKELYKVLDEQYYTDKFNTALKSTRDQLVNGLKSGVLDDFVAAIENKIDQCIKENVNNSSPPFFVLLNMHAFYNHIQTKDIISRIINKSNILILILYLDLSLTDLKIQKEEAYKLANYNVHTIHIEL